MTTSLVQYGNNGLIPHNWVVRGPAISVGNIRGYFGPIALVLTPNAVCIGAPTGVVQVVDFMEITNVRAEDMAGILITRQSEFYQKLYRPDPAWGVVIEYEPPVGIKTRVRALVFTRNAAEEWETAISSAVNGHKMSELGPYTIIEYRKPE